MTPSEKKQFINDMIDGVRGTILDRVDMMPDEWDGEELRRYVYDKFMNQTGKLMPGNVRGSGNSIRMRNYHDEIIKRGL